MLFFYANDYCIKSQYFFLTTLLLFYGDSKQIHKSVADPRFPVGGMDLVVGGGAWTPEAAMFRKILYVKMKESGPLEGRCAGHAP